MLLFESGDKVGRGATTRLVWSTTISGWYKGWNIPVREHIGHIDWREYGERFSGGPNEVRFASLYRERFRDEANYSNSATAIGGGQGVGKR